MPNGYTGKILKVNLTTGEIGAMDTSRYEEFGGGYGMGTAIFWTWRSPRVNGTSRTRSTPATSFRS